VWALQEKGYVTADVADAEGLHQLKLSGTKFRKMLRAGEDIPEWCGSSWLSLSENYYLKNNISQSQAVYRAYKLLRQVLLFSPKSLKEI
jgi:ATP sulfurylase